MYVLFSKLLFHQKLIQTCVGTLLLEAFFLTLKMYLSPLDIFGSINIIKNGTKNISLFPTKYFRSKLVKKIQGKMFRKPFFSEPKMSRICRCDQKCIHENKNPVPK